MTTSALTVAGCSAAFSVVTAGASVVTTASLFGTAATATSVVVVAVVATSAVACTLVVAPASTAFVSFAGIKISASFVLVCLATSFVASVEVTSVDETKSAVVSEFGCVTVLSCVSSAETEDVVAEKPPTTVASAADATAIVTHCFLTL